MEVDLFRTITEPMGRFKDWEDCMSIIGNERICGSIKARTETKLSESLKKGMITEMVNWRTYVRAMEEEDLIQGELLHVTVSGNGVDYTKEELLPSVNTLIGKPVYDIDEARVTMPDDLHKDPTKFVVGEIKLARFKDNAINFLAKVTHEAWLKVKNGGRPIGSIEAKFAVANESDKATAQFKPEFINFTGYLLLPPAGTETRFGATSPAGDMTTKNLIFEQISRDFACKCPSKML